MMISNGQRLCEVGSRDVSTTIRPTTNAITATGTAAASRHAPRHLHSAHTGAPMQASTSATSTGAIRNPSARSPAVGGFAAAALRSASHAAAVARLSSGTHGAVASATGPLPQRSLTGYADTCHSRYGLPPPATMRISSTSTGLSKEIQPSA